MFSKLFGGGKKEEPKQQPVVKKEEPINPEKIINDLNIQVAKIQNNINEKEAKLDKLDNEIRSLISAKKKQQAKQKISEAQ